VPDDHPLSYLTMRSTALRDADLIIVLGTRMTYIIGHAAPPRFGANAKIARIEIDAEEMGRSARNVDIPVVGDCKSVLQQLIDALPAKTAERFTGWRKTLYDGEIARRSGPRRQLPGRRRYPPAPPRGRGEEFRQPRRHPRRRRSGDPQFRPPDKADLRAGAPATPARSAQWAWGCPLRSARRLARPDKQVICCHGDGSFSLNALELDTAVRHKRQILLIISLNGGWTAEPQRNKPGRDLGYTRYDKMAEGLGCYGEYVERPEDIRPALERAQKKVDEGMVALVNVKTAYRARARAVQFSDYST
jgi:thiamine pyrophosphate-dependent acetolactate synthase large subunit-like protein